ncbi:hypothetical protein ACHAWO_010161 [Cyclotella atomus]|uniref:Uncharacterized protein n=1 Tax=Cyclotella atomus TaxID=382360 RepID=A0ABD3QFP9_9STRA
MNQADNQPNPMNQPAAAAAAPVQRLTGRKLIRFHIHRILLSRLPPQYRRFYCRSEIAQQVNILDEFAYKTSTCINEYSNLRTLERRILNIARKMRIMKMNTLFVRFNLRL